MVRSDFPEDTSDSLTFDSDVDIELVVKKEIRKGENNSETVKIGFNNKYFVYWLECHQPDCEKNPPRGRPPASWSRDAKYCAEELEPSCLDSAIRATSAHYVGYTSNPVGRIQDHANSEGAVFCQLFPPDKLRNIWVFDDKQTAQKQEEEIAHRINADINGYVYQK